MTSTPHIASQQPLRVIISGGGTGGHLFPALAIAEEIKRREPESDILFIGAKGRMEMERVPERGFRIEGLDIKGINRQNPLKNVLLPVKLFNSFQRVNQLLKEHQPDLVIGVGGYSSGPVLFAASRKGIPTLIQEQNFFPGLTNRLLSKRVDRICVAFEGMEHWFPAEKLRVLGNPIRQEIILAGQNTPTVAGQNVLVLGGSLGARSLNESIMAGLPRLHQAGVKLRWQCGKYYYSKLKEQLERLPEADRAHVSLEPFISDMAKAYAEASIVVSRAGAIALSELAVMGKAAILVPSPNVAEDHQTKNATMLTSKNAALLVPNAEAPARLAMEIVRLAEDEEQQKALAKQIRTLARPHATSAIVDEVFELVKRKTTAA